MAARSPGAGRLHGRQNHPPLSQLDDNLVIEERYHKYCDFEENREVDMDD